ncbi:MAG: hypothetical protein LQ342_003347 [Letrouitia transgressa]|nr:MAG: hypothetical protein LQ342_003347 [Letrouitia transgressa]
MLDFNQLRKAPSTNAISLDVSSATDLDKHASFHDIVISLVPYIYHAGVIKSAIKSKPHVVTTSYVSKATRALDAAATQAVIAVLNEAGVDPGVDHFHAIRKIGKVHAEKGTWSCFSTSSGSKWPNGPVFCLQVLSSLSLEYSLFLSDGANWLSQKTCTSTSTLELRGGPNGYSTTALSVAVTCGIAT